MHTPELYEIRVASHLSESTRRRFEGLSARLDPGGETVLSGMLDQSALHGALIVVRDLGLKLLSVNLVGKALADKASVAPNETPNAR